MENTENHTEDNVTSETYQPVAKKGSKAGSFIAISIISILMGLLFGYFIWGNADTEVVMEGETDNVVQSEIHVGDVVPGFTTDQLEEVTRLATPDNTYEFVVLQERISGEIILSNSQCGSYRTTKDGQPLDPIPCFFLKDYSDGRSPELIMEWADKDAFPMHDIYSSHFEFITPTILQLSQSYGDAGCHREVIYQFDLDEGSSELILNDSYCDN